MIMTLGLAVFSGLEWKLRNAMKTANVMLKSQTGKLTDKITMRYVFQIFSTFSLSFWKIGKGCSFTLAIRPAKYWNY